MNELCACAVPSDTVRVIFEEPNFSAAGNSFIKHEGAVPENVMFATGMRVGLLDAAVNELAQDKLVPASISLMVTAMFSTATSSSLD